MKLRDVIKKVFPRSLSEKEKGIQRLRAVKNRQAMAKAAKHAEEVAEECSQRPPLPSAS